MALLLATNGPFWPASAAADVVPFGTQQPRHGPDTLWLCYGAEPPTLDPALASDNQAGEFVGQLYAGLTRLVGPHLRVEGDLAERWDISADGLTYRFVLRPSSWSDGVPVTAHDFVFSIRRTLDPNMAAQNAQLLSCIEGAQADHQGRIDLAAVGVRAVDDATLEIKLAAPAPWLLQLCAHSVLRPVPAHQVRGARAWPKPSQLVTSGPYQVARWRFRRDALLTANPHYWAAKAVRIHKLRFTLVARPDTGMALYQDGELDLSPAPVPLAWQATLERTADYRRTPQLTSDYYWLNTLRPPLDDVRVRRALSLAIDRTRLVAAVLPRALPAASIVPPSLGGEPHTPAAYSPDEARALLAAAGFAGGRGLRPLSVTFNAHPEHRRVAEAIANMWQRELGIAVTLSQREWQVYLSEVTKRDFDIARLGWVADYAHARSFLLDVLGPDSQQNYSGWRDATFAGLLAQSDAEPDAATRTQLLKAAERRMLAAQPLLPLSFGQATQGVKPYVQGFDPAPIGPAPYHAAWLEAPAVAGGTGANDARRLP